MLRSGLKLAAGLVAAAMLYAQPSSAQESSSRPVSIRIHAKQRAASEIPRTIFGSFLEPIGNSTYNGLWAEILQNPSLESGLWSAPAVAAMLAERPELRRASELALPLPWEPLDVRQGNRYEPQRQDAANSWQSLSILGVSGQPTGIKQRVYLPAGRELRYHGSIYVKHLSGPSGIDISLRRRESALTILGHAAIQADSTEWRKYPFELLLAAGQLEPLEPADFVIQVAGDERALVDQLSLMPDDAIDGLDPEMVALAKAMHTPLIRFGGNFTSGYHWRDGVGPRDKRISMLNVAWGMPETNQFGTDEFLRFCELVGAEPQVALNLGSGTPEEAAGWVSYIDEHWKQHGGLLWELGNELWGTWNLGYPTLQELPERTLAFSRAVRGADPQARLIATGQDPDHFEKWNAAQLANPPGTFDFLSTHFVENTEETSGPRPGPETLAEAAFALPTAMERRLRPMQEQINQNASFRDKAHIAFTEWLFACCGRGRQAAPGYTNMGGAVIAGSFFNMLLRNAAVVPVSDMTGIIEFAGIWKKRGGVYAAPPYYAFQLFSTADVRWTVAAETNSPTYDVHGGVRRFPEIAGVPYLDVTAALNASGNKLTIFCVNRHFNQDQRAAISFDGFEAKGDAQVEELSSTSIYDENSEGEPEFIHPSVRTVHVGQGSVAWTFPHASITRIELSAK